MNIFISTVKKAIQGHNDNNETEMTAKDLKKEDRREKKVGE